MAKCLSCARGYFEECREYTVSNELCDMVAGIDEQVIEAVSKDQEIVETPDLNDADDEDDEDWRSGLRSTRRTKPDQALKDQQSTGRKRAARLYPLDRDSQCEWSFKERMGGGDNPIEGCFGNKQQARHHGPDKNTLNNDKGNVHRICHSCHNRWHAKNDPDYDPNKKLRH